MKLILITTPTYFVEEDKIITALFEEGLDTLHLRKPDTAPMFAERLLIPASTVLSSELLPPAGPCGMGMQSHEKSE